MSRACRWTSRDAVGTNTLATMLVALPMQPALSAAELLAAVHGATTAAKAFTGAVGSGAIAELADVTPPAALSAVTWMTRTLGLASAHLVKVALWSVLDPPGWPAYYYLRLLLAPALAILWCVVLLPSEVRALRRPRTRYAQAQTGPR